MSYTVGYWLQRPMSVARRPGLPNNFCWGQVVKLLRCILLIVTSLSATTAVGASCSAVFSDPAASYSPSGSITFNDQSRLVGSDGEIDFASMSDQSGGTSCDSVPCRISSNPSAGILVPAFEASTSTADRTVNSDASETLSAGDYQNIRLEPGASLTTLSSGDTFHIKSLSAQGSTTLTLQSGVYWIETLRLEQYANLEVATGANVVIHTKSFTAQHGNPINSAGTPDQLLVFSEGNVEFGQFANVKGYFYATNKATYADRVTHSGAVNGARVVLGQLAQITFDQNGLSTLQSDGLCTQPVMLPNPVARWSMNVCGLTGSADEVVDVIGGANGQSFEDPSIDSNGKLCQAAYFRGDGDHIRLPNRSAFQVSEGTISFWMRGDELAFENNSSNGGMALLSKDMLDTDSGQFTLFVTSGGNIQVNQESGTTTYQINSLPVINEGQWHHIVYSVGAAGMQLYVDRILVNSNTSYTGGWQSNNLPIVVGANAGQNNSSSYSGINDYYKGRIDDIRIYNSQLSPYQVDLLYAESDANCASCGSGARLVSHWKMDVCALNGSTGEVVDVINGHNGRAVDGARAERYGRFCQAAGFDGWNDHINIPHSNDYSLSSGSISMWFKVSDLTHNRDGNGDSLQALFSKDSANRDYGGQLTIYIDQDGRFLTKHETRYDTYQPVSSPVIEERERWYHLVYTWGNEGLKVYMDGLYLGRYNVSGGLTLVNNPEPIILGASAYNSSNGASYSNELAYHFLGDIDDVRIYDGELDVADVQSLYTASTYSCVSCRGDEPRLFYQFEEESWDAAGAVLDSSGEDNHGSPIGRVTPQLPSNDVSCRALDVPYNNRYSERDEVNSNLDLNNVGSRGTVSFWYRSDAPWIDGNYRLLFDATQSEHWNGDYGKYFFMSLNNNGEIAFGMEDSNDGDMQVKTQPLGYEANQWVHIGLTWDVASEDVNLYVNGNRVYMYGTWDFSSSVLGNVSTLKIGDSSSNYFVAEMTDNSANGQFDDFRLYDYEMSREAIKADMNKTNNCFSVHHYEVTHPEQSLTCSAASVTIKACADAACSELVNEPVSINLSNGNWSTASPVTFTGAFTTSLEQSSAGTHTIAITAANQESAPESTQQCTTDCNIDFVNAGFEFYDTAAPYASALPDIVAESDLSRIGLRAVRDNAGVCQALLTGTQSVTLGFDCVSGGADYSPESCSVPLAGVPVNGDGSGENSGSVSLTFNSNGETSLSGLSYADAGRVALSASAVVSGVMIESGSAQFDSLPASIVLSATAAYPQVAGQEFTLSMSARGANNSVLPGYSPGDLQMNLTRVAPTSSNATEAQLFVASSQSVTSATNPGWSGVTIDPFTDGNWQFTQAYINDVGQYTWDVQDANYLGNVISANSLGPGRMIPAYFDVSATTTPQLDDQCSSQFTYIGQPFDFVTGSEPELVVTAYNAKGQVTRNYSDALWQLNPGSSDLSAISVTDNSAYSGALSMVNGGDTPVVSDSSDYDGEGKITVLNTRLSYSKIPTPSPTAGNGSPFNADVSMTFGAAFFTDADGICYQTAYPGSCESYTFGSIQGTQMRYGRLRIENTFGPETETLRAPLVTEYYSDGNWLQNTQDSCTAISLSHSGGQLSLANLSMGNDEQDLRAYLPAISSSGTLVEGKSPSTMITLGPALNNGVALRGAVQITLEPAASGADWAQYLNIDWDGDGDIDSDDKPSAEAFFGIYRGNDRTLHMREGF